MRQAKTEICSTGKGIRQNQKTWLRFIFFPSKAPISLKENTVFRLFPDPQDHTCVRESNWNNWHVAISFSEKPFFSSASLGLNDSSSLWLIPAHLQIAKGSFFQRTYNLIWCLSFRFSHHLTLYFVHNRYFINLQIFDDYMNKWLS